jgi:hypothetical protein
MGPSRELKKSRAIAHQFALPLVGLHASRDR